jgi:uncharacterized membrane protein
MMSVVLAWGVLTLIGLAVWPFLFVLKTGWFDRGWALARLFALTLVWAVIWLGAHMQIIRFTATITIAVGGILIFIGVVGWIRNRGALSEFVRAHWKTLVISEAVFAITLLLFGLARGMNPDITGTEKPMEYMLLQSIAGGSTLPAHDAWFVGGQMAYYYGGYVLVVVLGHLSQITLGTLFVITPALIAALGAQLAYATVLSIVKNPVSALVAPLLLFSANLVGIKDALSSMPPIDWWASSRVFKGAITEFPSFSVLLGDVHPHLIALPFIIALLYLALSPITPGVTIIWGLLVGALVVINPWSSVMTGLLLIVWLIAKRPITKKIILRIVAGAAIALIVILVWFLAAPHAPQRFALSTEHTSPLAYWQMFGLFFLVGVTSLLFLHLTRQRFRLHTILFLIASAIVIALPELVHLDDFFGGQSERMNTIFKFWFDGWTVAAVEVAILAALAINVVMKTLRGKVIAGTLLFTLVVVTLSYPVQTARTLASRASGEAFQGEAWLARQDGGDLTRALAWVRGNLASSATIIEPVARLYTLDNLFSTYSGRSTVIGWGQHEALWRGDWQAVQARVDEVEAAYRDPTPERWEALINKYKIAAIVVYSDPRRNLPREEAGVAAARETLHSSLDSLGTSTFESATLTIFKVKER